MNDRLLTAKEVWAERKVGDQLVDVLYETLISPNERDRNMEAANVVDGLFAIARAINRLAEASGSE